MTDYAKWSRLNASIPDDDDDRARAKLRELKDGMSEPELKRIHECWHQPEFKSIYNEYEQTVSDPKHRAETEQYLTQCEAEQRAASKQRAAGEALAASAPSSTSATSCGSAVGGAVPAAPPAPEGSELIKPKKGFVLKTYKRSAEINTKASDDSDQQKREKAKSEPPPQKKAKSDPPPPQFSPYIPLPPPSPHISRGLSSPHHRMLLVVFLFSPTHPFLPDVAPNFSHISPLILVFAGLHQRLRSRADRYANMRDCAHA